MLLLIGGAPAVGKSTVAQEIARDLRLLRLVDFDVVRDVMRIQSREQDDPALFRNALNAYELHGEFSPSNVIAGFQSHVRPLAGAASRLLESYLGTNKSAVFHGVPLVPSQFARYRARGVHFALLAAPSEDTYRRRLAERGRARAGREPSAARLDAGWLIHQHLVSDALENGVPVIAEDEAGEAAAMVLRRIRS
jgi:2-phosphoglycerate kinase